VAINVRVKFSLIFFIALVMVKTSFSQEVKTVSFDELMKILNDHNGSTKVVNFWATWCKPCVDELPYFVQAADKMKNENFEFIFVSVDFLSVHASVVEKAKQIGLKGTLLHLNAPGNEWIDQVDSTWSGAIPYTILILPNRKRSTHYDQFDNYEALKSFLDKNIPN
jgi:thiol-disulfide isomerase/thioredoxin